MTIRLWSIALMLLTMVHISCEGVQHTPNLQTSRTAMHTTAQHTIEQHQWKHRLLLIFAPTAQNPIAAAQKQMALNQLEGYRQRHLRVYLITPKTTLYMSPQQKRWHTKTVQLQGDIQAWRSALRLNEDKKTHVVLVGKDGQSKRRTQQAILTNNTLFATIDAMPMRQQEMNARRSIK